MSVRGGAEDDGSPSGKKGGGGGEGYLEERHSGGGGRWTGKFGRRGRRYGRNNWRALRGPRYTLLLSD